MFETELKDRFLIKILLPLLNQIDEIIYKLYPDLIVWRSASLNITGRCNSRCIMCNYAKIYQNKSELDTNQWKRIIDRLHDFGINNFAIMGGEALMRDDCFEIAEYCKGKRSITTNSILINEDNAKRIVNIFETIAISIDGSNPEIYKKVRGVDYFNKVVENVKLLKSLGANIKIYCEINKYNYLDVVNIAKLINELDLDLVFGLVSWGGFNNILTDDRSLREDIDFTVLKKLISKALKYKHVFLWITVRDKLQGRQPLKCYSTIWGPLIDPVGDIFLCCGSLPSIGNILKDNFTDIWKKYKKIRYSLLNMNFKECHNCSAYTGNFEHIQELMRRIMKKPVKKFIKKIYTIYDSK